MPLCLASVAGGIVMSRGKISTSVLLAPNLQPMIAGYESVYYGINNTTPT